MPAQVAYLNINQGLRKKPFWWIHNPSFHAVDELVEILKEMQKPRIFAASEVALREWNSRKNVFEKIAHDAGFSYAEYASSFRFPEIVRVRNTTFDAGNALFSDLPLEEKIVGAFPGHAPVNCIYSRLFGNRTFMINKVRHDKGSMYVIVSHLHLGFLSRAHRQRAAKLLSKIGRRIEGPALLLVDANSPPVYVPDSKRHNYGSNLMIYLWLSIFDRKHLRDWISEDHRHDRTLNMLEYGFPQDVCPVSCYKRFLHDDENEPFKTFDDRIIDYALGKDIPQAKYYHVIGENLSDHRMIAFELELPAKEAKLGNIENLLYPPKETLPYQAVETAKVIPEVPGIIIDAAKSAGNNISEKWSRQAKKALRRLAGQFGDKVMDIYGVAVENI